jgi:hypothetical protein
MERAISNSRIWRIHLYHKGKKQFIIEEDTIVLEAGQSIKYKNTRVQYSNPFDEPCEYIAICTPAFDFNKVHREDKETVKN